MSPAVQQVVVRKRARPELVANGDFSSASGWTLNNPGNLATLTISGGTLNADDGAGVGPSASRAIATTIGRTYRLVFTITSISSGTMVATVSGAAATGRSAPGTYTQDLVASAAGQVLFDFSDVLGIHIDDVSVKEAP